MFSNCSGAEAPLGRDRRGRALTGQRRLRADGAGGELGILRLHRGQHRRGRQVVGAQLVGIQPDAHRVLGAKLHHRADSGQALDLVEHARGDDVVQLIRARPPGAERRPMPPQESRAHLGDADALLIHFRRQARRGAA